MLEQLTQTLANLWSKQRSQLIYCALDAKQVDDTRDYVALQKGRHYVRLWLAQVYLAKQVQYFQTWYPAVHSLVKFTFDAQPIAFPSVADASKVGMKQLEVTGDVIARNYVITPLIPFNDGTIDIDAGLVAIQGQNYLKSFLETLSDFSSLLAVPQFSAALSVAGPLAKGLEGLLGTGGVKLALHDGFAEGRMGGYWLALAATEQDVAPADLNVRNGQVCLVNRLDRSLCAPLEGYDFMLFRIEVTEQGPDYKNLSTIQDQMKAASKSLLDGDADKAGAYYRAAIVAAHEAPELTNADRTRMKLQLKDDFAKLKNDLGFSGLVGHEFDLSESMARAIPVARALEMGDPSFGELFAE